MKPHMLPVPHRLLLIIRRVLEEREVELDRWQLFDGMLLDLEAGYLRVMELDFGLVYLGQNRVLAAMALLEPLASNDLDDFNLVEEHGAAFVLQDEDLFFFDEQESMQGIR